MYRIIFSQISLQDGKLMLSLERLLPTSTVTDQLISKSDFVLYMKNNEVQSKTWWTDSGGWGACVTS
jgi:hypothetical protein